MSEQPDSSERLRILPPCQLFFSNSLLSAHSSEANTQHCCFMAKILNFLLLWCAVSVHVFFHSLHKLSIYPFLIIQCFCDWHDENKLSFFLLLIAIFTSYSSHTNFYMFISRHRVAMDWNSISTIATPHHKLSTERRVQDLCAYNADWMIPTAVEWAAKQWQKNTAYISGLEVVRL